MTSSGMEDVVLAIKKEAVIMKEAARVAIDICNTHLMYEADVIWTTVDDSRVSSIVRELFRKYDVDVQDTAPPPWNTTGPGEDGLTKH
ncbi:MAG: hypothetical protein KDA17_07360, partial [Candidatus Saccharibacteria bacterium]|nr:hypothetical protein [Candidatus Saccharibacteria bacterium]